MPTKIGQKRNNHRSYLIVFREAWVGSGANVLPLMQPGFDSQAWCHIHVSGPQFSPVILGFFSRFSDFSFHKNQLLISNSIYRWVVKPFRLSVHLDVVNLIKLFGLSFFSCFSSIFSNVHLWWDESVICAFEDILKIFYTISGLPFIAPLQKSQLQQATSHCFLFWSVLQYSWPEHLVILIHPR